MKQYAPITPEEYLHEHDGDGYLSLRTRALMAIEKYGEDAAETAFYSARDKLYNPSGTFREYRFVNYEHYKDFIKQAKEAEIKSRKQQP